MVKGLMAALGAALVCAPAAATVTIESSPASFIFSAGGAKFKAFDIDLGGVQGLSLGSTYQVGPVRFESTEIRAFSNASFTHEGDPIASPTYLDTTSALHITSDSAVLGIYFGAYDGCCGLRLVANGPRMSYLAPLPNNHETAFLGIIDPSGIDFTVTGNFHDLAVVALLLPIPEPATWAMMIIGFGAAGTAARRARFARPLSA